MTSNIIYRFLSPLLVLLSLLTAAECCGADKPAVTFKQLNNKLVIQIDGKPFAEYVFRDPKLARPYFCNIYTPAGIKVTRNHPAKKGDQQDHPHHTGIFFTFGDLNGHDFWHGKGITRHLEFIAPPGKPARDRIFRCAKSLSQSRWQNTLLHGNLSLHDRRGTARISSDDENSPELG